PRIFPRCRNNYTRRAASVAALMTCTSFTANAELQITALRAVAMMSTITFDGALCGARCPNLPKVLRVFISSRASAWITWDVAQEKPSSTSVRPTSMVEPITCPHCGGRAYLMRRTLHPKIKGEIWTFQCRECGKQTEKSALH